MLTRSSQGPLCTCTGGAAPSTCRSAYSPYGPFRGSVGESPPPQPTAPVSMPAKRSIAARLKDGGRACRTAAKSVEIMLSLASFNVVMVASRAAWARPDHCHEVLGLGGPAASGAPGQTEPKADARAAVHDDRGLLAIVFELVELPEADVHTTVEGERRREEALNSAPERERLARE